MTLKADAVSEGYRAVIYDNDDPSRWPVWKCLCTPLHSTKESAKLCAKVKIKQLNRKAKK